MLRALLPQAILRVCHSSQMLISVCTEDQLVILYPRNLEPTAMTPEGSRGRKGVLLFEK